MPTMNLPAIRAKRQAWNKGRLVGQKRPLLPKHVWAIRVRLEISEKVRDLAIFNLAIDSKLRGCDLVKLKATDVFAAGQVKERTSITLSKTKKPVHFEITEGTRISLADWLNEARFNRRMVTLATIINILMFFMALALNIKDRLAYNDAAVCLRPDHRAGSVRPKGDLGI